MTPIEYCNKKIKEASEAADIKAFLAYTEMLTVWQRIEDDKKGAPSDG